MEVQNDFNTFVTLNCTIKILEKVVLDLINTVNELLSQPKNNHNPNNKTTITVVGLRLSNCWEYHHHPPHKLKTT